MSKLSPFDFINAINQGKDLFAASEDPKALEKQYVPYIVNKTFSYFPDTVLYANEMNLHHQLSPRLQNTFLLSIRPRKRFAKWHKTDANDGIDLIREHFNCSLQVAEAYAKVLTPEAMKRIRAQQALGGKE